MEKFITLLSFLTLLCIHRCGNCLASPSFSFIQETCNKSAQSDPLLNYTFCMASLVSAPTNSTFTNLQTLGIVSAQLALANATSTMSHLENFLINKTHEALDQECLLSCLDEYSDAVPILRDSVEAFKSNRCDDANIWMSAAMDSSTNCQEAFQEMQGRVSPLTQQNYNLFQLSAIGLAITSQLC